MDEAGAFLLTQFQTALSCLFIVNTKKWAKALYQYCQQQNVPSEALFHLSTNQCAAHRKEILKKIKQRLPRNIAKDIFNELNQNGESGREIKTVKEILKYELPECLYNKLFDYLPSEEQFKQCKQVEDIEALFENVLPENIFVQLKQKFEKGFPIICISTQLIEAGVDISMACVIRALGGLDSIAQAAGRCNRHGENAGKGWVWVLNLQEPSLAKVLPDIDAGQQQAERVLREFAGQDILQPKAMRQYFEYYFYQRSDEMAYQINKNGSDSLLSWLSDNRYNQAASDRNGKLKNDVLRGHNLDPLLMHSFKSAGRAFQVIDAPTRAVIVPYGEGKALIAKLCGEYEPKAFYGYLNQAQRFSVNVFPNVWDKLLKEAAVQQIADTGIYYLHTSHYIDEYGLSVDEVGLMDFLCS